MAKKIVMILSLLRNNAKLETFSYLCPDGQHVDGALSNEPSIKYLLNSEPDISEILCICTPEAEANSLGYFTTMIEKSYFDRITITKIPYNGAKETFENGPLPRILCHTESGDEMYLETTGGMRNDIMHLLLITRVLLYTGISIKKAVYTQFSPNEVQDITHITRMFDLVEGVQDLSSFGNISMLRKYYGKPANDEKIEALLVSVEKLVEAITLCHVDSIDELMADFNIALTEAAECDDTLMRQLLPTFRNKFGKDKKLKIPGLIRWCIDSGMIQQALTVYTEKMPDYIINQRSGEYLSRIPQGYLGTTDSGNCKNQYTIWFNDSLLNLACRLGRYNGGEGEKEIKFTMLVRNKYRDILRTAFSTSNPDLYCPEADKDQQRGLSNLLMLLRSAYPNNGSYNTDWTSLIPTSCEFIKEFNRYLNNDCHPDSAEAFLREFNYPDNQLIKMMCETMPMSYYKPILGQDNYVATIENLEELLQINKQRNGQEIDIKCPVEQIKTVLRDYIYIKMLRNIVSHAASGNISSRTAQEWYLTKTPAFTFKGETYTYPPIDGISAAQITAVLIRALEHTVRYKETSE